jgi:hypothetical protein
MTVVRRDAQRRWSIVVAGVAVLCLLPLIVSVWPVGRATADPEPLRRLVLASVSRPYSGYADSQGQLRLPDLPALGDVAALLSSSTRMRAWYAGPQAWRVAVFEPTGERDYYGTDMGAYVWDFERNLVTYTVGETPVRLPAPGDLLPPELARRLLAGAGPGDAVTALPARRVAGVSAAGLRLAPKDPDTTIGRVDVWADPTTGLPLQIEIGNRADGATVFTSRFLDVDQRTPTPDLVKPAVPDSAGFTATSANFLTATLNGIARGVTLPPRLVGRARAVNPVSGLAVGGVGAYGAGLSTFVVLALPGRTASDAMAGLRDRGGLPVIITNGEGYESHTSLVSALIVQYTGDRRLRRTYVLAGPVTPDLLRRAAVELFTAVETTP